jgi:electron transfer flavoprotein beta subunit
VISGMTPPVVVACMKRVELLAGVDPLTGDVLPDPASAGPSPADEAALEWALRLGEAAQAGVVVVSAGGPECDSMLRGAIAAGATRAVRVPVTPDSPDAPDALDAVSPVVARALGRAVAFVASTATAASVAPAHSSLSSDVSGVVVCCGDASVDRGSGSVPAFLAGELGIAQALGLVGVSLAKWTPSGEQVGAGGSGDESVGESEGESRPGHGRSLEVERRLDRGRRERLRLTPPFVISVEAGTARLRRASLQRSLTARNAAVEVLPPEAPGPGAGVELVSWEPYRPRTRVVPPPAAGLGPRERIAALTGALHERPSARTLVLGAEAAAGELLSTLAEWGELPEGILAVAGPEPERTELP